MQITVLMRTEEQDIELVMEACSPHELGAIMVSLPMLAEDDCDFDYHNPLQNDNQLN
jgi:hypothetical protein